jgi:hypothetical protein
MLRAVGHHSVRYRRAALMVVLAVCLDLTNPFVGAAFTFDTESSVEVVSRPQQRPPAPAQAAAIPVPPAEAASIDRHRAPVARAHGRAIGEWFVHLRRAHAPLADPQSATEDH